MAGIIKVNQYQDFNGNTLFTSDGNGNLTTQNLMYPAFEAYLSSDQTVNTAQNTKAEIDTKLFDTDNCYDNITNYRFTPNVAGKYFVYVRLTFQSSIATDLRDGELRLFKNGSEYSTTDWRFAANDIQTAGATLNTTVDMNGTTDYLEVYGYNNCISGTPTYGAGSISEKRTLFGAYRIGS
jgi:hypothetical protein